MQLPFAAVSKREYDRRIQKNLAPVAALRLTIVGKSGFRHHFVLHTFAPMIWDKAPRHLYTPCGRFIVLRNRVELDDETTVCTDQFAVYYNGESIAEERFAIRHTMRAKQYKPASAAKQSHGRATPEMFSQPITL